MNIRKVNEDYFLLKNKNIFPAIFCISSTAKQQDCITVCAHFQNRTGVQAMQNDDVTSVHSPLHSWKYKPSFGTFFRLKYLLISLLLLQRPVNQNPNPVRKNHACETCGKAFRDVYHLNRHRLSHSDEKPFSCPICQQRFKRKDRMSHHVRSHQGGVEKPYVCQHCAKAFSRYRPQISTHWHCLQYVCTLLNHLTVIDMFLTHSLRPDHLNSHVRQVHSSERPFKCPVWKFVLGLCCNCIIYTVGKVFS